LSLQTLAKTANFCARFDKSYTDGFSALHSQAKNWPGFSLVTAKKPLSDTVFFPSAHFYGRFTLCPGRYTARANMNFLLKSSDALTRRIGIYIIR
jgi:hypothetical protein